MVSWPYALDWILGDPVDEGASTPLAAAVRRPARPRRRRSDYYVKHMPPPWRRSLTESGMRRATTRVDVAVVVVFAVAMVVLAVWLAGTPYL
jgi:hypothetical protein